MFLARIFDFWRISVTLSYRNTFALISSIKKGFATRANWRNLMLPWQEEMGKVPGFSGFGEECGVLGMAESGWEKSLREKRATWEKTKWLPEIHRNYLGENLLVSKSLAKAPPVDKPKSVETAKTCRVWN